MKTKDFDRLHHLLNYVSGDSWNGTHGRSITVELPDDERIIVHNHNDMFPTDIRSETFLLADVMQVQHRLKGAKHYDDFQCAWFQADKATKTKLEMKADLIENAEEIIAKSGTTSRTPRFKKMVIIKRNKIQF